MTEGRSKKISELPTVNTVSSSDLIVVNANVSGNIVTSAIAVNNFIRSAVGNLVSSSLFTETVFSNSVVTATGATPVSYFTYDRTAHVGAEIIFDMVVANTASDGANNRAYGKVIVTANSTVANSQATGLYVQIGAGTQIDPEAGANVSGNTVSVYLSGPTGNVQVRYLATKFKV